jgi:Family of unknown function (DUF5681)
LADGESDYKVGPGKPPLHTRFKKGQSGNPGGRSPKNLATLLADALNEKVYVTIDGKRRRITKREAIVTQMVNKSTSADLRATKMLIDMLKGVEQKAGVASPPPAPHPLTEADEQVVEQLIERIRHQVLQEIAEGKTADPRI